MASKEHQDLVVLAAWMYYDERLTQGQIARKLNLSRVSVTRLLQKARHEGIVEVRMTKPLPVQYDLARRLQAAYGLKDAVIVKRYDSWDETLEAVGQTAAEHLNQVIFPGCRLGVIGWSRTMGRMFPYLKPAGEAKPSVVNELLGSFMGENSRYNISGRIAEVLGAPIEALPVPVVVRSKAARDAILEEEAISLALQHARQCDIAFVGLGHIGPDWTMVQTGYMTPEQAAELRRQGAVGDVLVRYFDIEGRRVHTDLDERIISIEWEDILRIPYVVAVACGPHKVEPILGALRGRLCRCLITDTETAQQVLQQSGL